MGTHDVENIEAGDELYIDGREATVDWALGGEFCVTYENGDSRTIGSDETHNLIKEEDLNREERIAKFVPYLGMRCHDLGKTTSEEIEEPMVAIHNKFHGAECMFNAAAMKRGHLHQYQHANLLVSDHPYVFAISPVVKSETHSGTVEFNYRSLDISNLAHELKLTKFFKRDGMGDHRWLPTQWDEVNEMFIVDVSILCEDLIVDRKTNRE